MGDVAERAEEWVVSVSGSGDVSRIEHKLPQGRPGPSIEESEARAIARAAVHETFLLDPLSLKEVSAVSNKLPARAATGPSPSRTAPRRCSRRAS